MVDGGGKLCKRPIKAMPVVSLMYADINVSDYAKLFKRLSFPFRLMRNSQNILKIFIDTQPKPEIFEVDLRRKKFIQIERILGP